MRSGTYERKRCVRVRSVNVGSGDDGSRVLGLRRTTPTATMVAAVVLSIVVTLAGLVAPPAGAEAQVTPPTPVAQVAQNASPGVRDSIVRLYGSVFAREPDPGGLDYWVGRYLTWTPLDTIARSFMDADEWRLRYGEVGDDRFVSLLYNNVLGREPDEPGRQFWTTQLAGGMSRSAMLLGFSESPENVLRTGTAPPEQPPPPPRPAFPALPAGSGTGRRIVYSDSMQRVWLVESDERVVDSYLVSGRRGVPSRGAYRVYSKSPLAWAGYDGITMRHMVRFARGATLAIGFHSIPRYRDGRPLQTEAQLGTYRSSGCIRQADAKAEALYHWAPLGTVVVVTA